MGEKREAWKMIESIRDRGDQPHTGVMHLYGETKKAAMRAVNKARRIMKEEPKARRRWWQKDDILDGTG